MLVMPFRLNQNRRRHIPRTPRRVTNWPAYDASLRQRGSLTVWFTDNAITGWAAAHDANDARRPVLVFLARHPDGAHVARGVPPRLPASRGTDRLRHWPAWPQLARARPYHLEPACGDAGCATAGERRRQGWRRAHAPAAGQHGPEAVRQGRVAAGEARGTATRRSWRMLHLGVDAGTGRIVASTLTPKDVDDASQADPLARPGRRVCGVVHRRRCV